MSSLNLFSRYTHITHVHITCVCVCICIYARYVMLVNNINISYILSYLLPYQIIISDKSVPITDPLQYSLCIYIYIMNQTIINKLIYTVGVRTENNYNQSR